MVMGKMRLAIWEDVIKEVKGVLWVDGYMGSWKAVEVSLERVTRSKILRQ